jgi:hypothetical protein
MEVESDYTVEAALRAQLALAQAEIRRLRRLLRIQRRKQAHALTSGR